MTKEIVTTLTSSSVVRAAVSKYSIEPSSKYLARVKITVKSVSLVFARVSI